MRRLACALLAAVALGGCGLGEGESLEGDGAEVRVTRDFGRELLDENAVAQVRDGQTVMRLLRSDADVKTRYGGRFVQSIDGLAGSGEGGFADWFYFVNGIEAAVGAADYELSPGDVIQWDYRNWRVTPDVRATVGAFPEPFVHGLEGKRRPVRVECADAGSPECRDVKDLLRDAGVPATGAALGAAGVQNVIRVVVAPWARARELPSARALEQGPKRSGVFARFRDGGRRVELLDEDGGVARTDGPGTGILAALRPRDDELLWLVTGGDEAGVRRAAAVLGTARTRDAFAVAAPPAGIEKLPLPEAGT